MYCQRDLSCKGDAEYTNDEKGFNYSYVILATVPRRNFTQMTAILEIDPCKMCNRFTPQDMKVH